MPIRKLLLSFVALFMVSALIVCSETVDVTEDIVSEEDLDKLS